MKKINNSNFELLQDVIKSMDFGYKPEECDKLAEIEACWKETIGEKIFKMTKVFKISDENILTILCSDSFVSNELFSIKDKLLEMMNTNTEKLGIKIKDIKFSFKQWKETDYEKK